MYPRSPRRDLSLKPKRAQRLPYPKSKMKHTFRIRAHDQKNRLFFFKTRTKTPEATIKRFATLKGFTIDRIKH